FGFGFGFRRLLRFFTAFVFIPHARSMTQTAPREKSDEHTPRQRRPIVNPAGALPCPNLPGIGKPSAAASHPKACSRGSRIRSGPGGFSRRTATFETKQIALGSGHTHNVQTAFW